MSGLKIKFRKLYFYLRIFRSCKFNSSLNPPLSWSMTRILGRCSTTQVIYLSPRPQFIYSPQLVQANNQSNRDNIWSPAAAAADTRIGGHFAVNSVYLHVTYRSTKAAAAAVAPVSGLLYACKQIITTRHDSLSQHLFSPGVADWLAYEDAIKRLHRPLNILITSHAGTALVTIYDQLVCWTNSRRSVWRDSDNKTLCVESASGPRSPRPFNIYSTRVLSLRQRVDG